jgi:hypothetical protein
VKGTPCAAAALLAVAAPAHAHGFGQRYDLPLPLSLYICGAALTVVVSCLMLAFYVRRAPTDSQIPQLDLLSTRVGRALASPAVVGALRGLAVALYFLLLFAGFFGDANPFRNIAPVAIWALWWVGLAYFSALVGDLWRVVNPLDTIFAVAEPWIARRFRTREAPESMRSWPVVACFLVFIWMEVAWEGSDSPFGVAVAMAAYSALTWLGMAIFGREAWLAQGEVFSRVFGLLARFSPMQVDVRGRRIAAWRLRPYAVGLLQREPLDASAMALVIVLLASVSFDGFLETPAWAAIVEAGAGESSGVLRAGGLLAASLLFAAVYLLFSRLIALGGADPAITTRRIAGLFVLTLVPIAIAYEVAHYLSFLVQAGQYAVTLASDPFGWGWNLFGTKHHFVRPAIVDARLTWIVSLVAIVAGHIAALYLGHVLSLREYADRRKAVRSQGPMLVLMVAYTMLSLWIIAQPVVSSR